MIRKLQIETREYANLVKQYLDTVNKPYTYESSIQRNMRNELSEQSRRVDTCIRNARGRIKNRKVA